MKNDPILDQVESLVASGDLTRAQRVLRHTVRRFPHKPELWVLLATVLTETPQKRDCLRRALALDPRHPNALAALAELDHASTPPASSHDEPLSSSDVSSAVVQADLLPSPDANSLPPRGFAGAASGRPEGEAGLRLTIQREKVEYAVTRERWTVTDGGEAALSPAATAPIKILESKPAEAHSQAQPPRRWIVEAGIAFVFGVMLAAGAVLALLYRPTIVGGRVTLEPSAGAPWAVVAVANPVVAPPGDVTDANDVQAGSVPIEDVSAPSAPPSMPADLAEYIARADAFLGGGGTIAPALPSATAPLSPNDSRLPSASAFSVASDDPNRFTTYTQGIVAARANQGEQPKPPDDLVAGLQEAIGRAPDFPQAYLALSRLQLARGEARAALTSANAGIDLTPRDAALLAQRAEVYLALDAYQSARDDAHLAVYLAPRSENAYLTLARASAAQATATGSAPTDALRVLQDLVAALPDSLTGWMALGDMHRDLGEAGAAIDAYSTALALDSVYGPALIARGEVYLDRQEWAKARADFMSVLTSPRLIGDRRRATIDLAQLTSAQTRPNDALAAQGIVSAETWLTPLPQHAVGKATFYGPSWGLLQDLAQFHGYDLTGYKGGVALPSPADLGKTVWLRPPGGEWEGPFLAVDAARRDDFYNVVYAKGEIVEVPYEVAQRWGIEFVMAGVEVFVGSRPPRWSTPSPYRPELRWDAGDSPIIWPQPPQDFADK